MSKDLRTITASRVDPEAAKVVRRLVRYGYEAFLVGGCVRDLLLGETPKDFDVSTNATPTEIKKVFRNCRIIGRRFRLAHIYFGRKIIETSTFRAAPSEIEERDGDGQIIWRDNVFGSAEEDAHRRDFTINGLFFDLINGEVIDNVGGLDDLKAGSVRSIGDPLVRFQEDPVRILRAIKFAARLDLTIEPVTWQAMIVHRGQVALCSTARVLEEVYRLVGSGSTCPAFELLHKAGVLPILFPELSAVLDSSEMKQSVEPLLAISPGRRKSEAERPASPVGKADRRAGDNADSASQNELGRQEQGVVALLELLELDDEENRLAAAASVWAHLAALDASVKQKKETPSHALLLGALVAPLLERVLGADNRLGWIVERVDAAVDALSNRLQVSRKDKERLKQILVAQRRLVYSRPRAQLASRDYFNDAFDLLVLRQAVAENPEHVEIIARWQELSGGRSKRPKPRRRSGRKLPRKS